MLKPFYYIKTNNTLSITTTGNFCALNCKHCNKHYLKHMIDFKTLFNDKNKLSNYTSFLVSGGSNTKGYVPFFKYLKEIEILKKNNKLINLHTGLLDPEYFKYLKYIDSISIDIIGDDHTIKYVYNLNKKSKDYFQYFDSLIKYKEQNKLTFKVVPHITIGLNEGKYSGEIESIKFLSNYELDTIVFLILIPTKGTYFENINPPEQNFVKEIFQTASYYFNNKHTNLFLGCMRPKGKYRKEIDKVAILNGINGIVNPTFSIEYIEKFVNSKFTKIIKFNDCCSLT